MPTPISDLTRLNVQPGTLGEFCRTFFIRPYGGMEVELIIMASEIRWGIGLICAPEGLEKTRALADLYHAGVPAWHIGACFLVAGVLTLAGMVLYAFYMGSPTIPKRVAVHCADLRAAGCGIGSFLWGYLAWKTMILLNFQLPADITYAFFALWSVIQMRRSFVRRQIWLVIPQE